MKWKKKGVNCEGNRENYEKCSYFLFELFYDTLSPFNFLYYFIFVDVTAIHSNEIISVIMYVINFDMLLVAANCLFLKAY